VDGARAFYFGGGRGCLLVAGGTIGLRFIIRKGTIDIKAFGGMGEPWCLRHLGANRQPSFIVWRANEVERLQLAGIAGGLNTTYRQSAGLLTICGVNS